MSAFCVSCIQPFDLEYEDEPIIYLASFPGVEDKVVFTIEPAYSLSNSAVRPEFKPDITFAVNGTVLPVLKNTGGRFGAEYPEDCYVADYKPVPGDEMTVGVVAEGYKSVFARTSIPQPFPERKIDYRQVKVGETDYNVIYVTFKDDARSTYAYGLQILNEWIYDWPGEDPEVSIWEYAGAQIADDFTMAPQSLDGMGLYFDGWSISTSESIACWSDATFNGEEKTLSMTVRTNTWQGGYDVFFEHESQQHYYDENGEIVKTGTALEHNKLVMYAMTEEFYKFAVAQELASENAGFVAGLAPSNFCYSNIENGYGAFAGVCRVETDWITKEFIENNR